MEYKKLGIIALSALIIAIFSFSAIAQGKDSAKTEAKTVSIEAKTASAAESVSKNMTFGQCVSDEAKLKNGCYASANAKLDTCKNASAENRNSMKQCTAEYNKEKKSCKADFKSGKTECKKIKHGFMEGVMASFA